MHRQITSSPTVTRNVDSHTCRTEMLIHFLRNHSLSSCLSAPVQKSPPHTSTSVRTSEGAGTGRTGNWKCSSVGAPKILLSGSCQATRLVWLLRVSATQRGECPPGAVAATRGYHPFSLFFNHRTLACAVPVVKTIRPALTW